MRSGGFVMSMIFPSAVLAGIAALSAVEIRAQEVEPPNIIAGTNREMEATYSNNCVVYYTASGQRRQANPNCSRDQVRRADIGAASYRREQGWDGPVGDEAPPGGFSAPPEIIMGRNGLGRAVVDSRCTVYFDQAGRRQTVLPSCNKFQLRQADDAMERHRREQGIGHVINPVYPTTPEILTLKNGNLETIMGNGCVVFFRPNGGLLSSMPNCTAGQRAQAAIAVLRFRREQGR